MKGNSEYPERWVQDLVAEDPSIIGLGALDLWRKERTQPTGGRVDLILTDPQDERRYAVEIQLGATDESHIIRTIEYWDNERRRYPQVEHCAVIVAEEITSRFFNVISLFNRTIPIIAIQMSLLQVGDNVTLHFTTVLDERHLAPDIEEPEGTDILANRITDRMTEAQKAQCDYFLKEIIRPVVEDCELNPTMHYLGILRRNRVENFINIWPRATVCHIWFKYPRDASMDQLISSYGLRTLAYSHNFGFYRIALTSIDDIERNKDALRDLTKRSFKFFSEGETS